MKLKNIMLIGAMVLTACRPDTQDTTTNTGSVRDNFVGACQNSFVQAASRVEEDKARKVAEATCTCHYETMAAAYGGTQELDAAIAANERLPTQQWDARFRERVNSAMETCFERALKFIQ